MTTNFENLIEIADELLKTGEYDDAVEVYTKAIETTVANGGFYAGILYYNRSKVYVKIYEQTNELNWLLKSMLDATQVCSINPQWYKGYAQAGRVYELLNDLLMSIQFYESALTLQPNNEELAKKLASIKSQIVSPDQFREDVIDVDFNKMNIHFDEPNEKTEAIKAEMAKTDPSVLDVWKGHEYRDGSKDKRQNYKAAAKYYSKAARMKNPEALYNLALLTMNGHGVAVNYKLAIDLFKQAASQPQYRKINFIEHPNVGVCESQHQLGLHYENEKNYEEAIKWYSIAIEHGNGDSAKSLGLVYMNGVGVEQDFKLAEELLCFAYTKGNKQIASHLVDLNIMKGDANRAQMWHERSKKSHFSIFALLHDDEIKRKINAIEQKINPKRIEIIKLHRKFIYDLNELNCGTEYFFNTHNPSSLLISQTQPTQIPEQSSCKNIYLKDIDFTRDQILNGYSITCTTIDMPIQLVSVTILVEDVNKDVERVAVYNLDETDEQYKKICQIGCVFKILNPYIRTAIDGRSIIRVDSPNTMLHIIDHKYDICYCCGETPTVRQYYTCSKCKLAKYCSDKCQQKDSNLLYHEFICGKT